MKKNKINLKYPESSVLVVTLIILSIVTVSALSIYFVAVQERKGSIGASKTSAAYQVADSGIEKVLQDIFQGGHENTRDLFSCQSSGLLYEKVAAGSYTVELKDANGYPINCNTGLVANIKKVKATGIVGQNSRAIQVSIK